MLDYTYDICPRARNNACHPTRQSLRVQRQFLIIRIAHIFAVHSLRLFVSEA